MALRIDPRLSVLWRDPFTAQVGADHARVVVHIAAGWQERVLHAVRIGTTRAALTTLVGRDALSSQLDAFLAQLSPVLERSNTTTMPTVGVEGQGPLASVIARLAHRLEVLRDCDTDPDVIVLVGQHVLTPMRLIRWAGQRRWLLPALAGDASIRIGPLLGGDGGPCPTCLSLHRKDDDAAWPMLAAQLIDQEAPAESDSLLVAEAAAAVLRGALALGDADAAPRVELTLDRSGAHSERRIGPHPNCGCVQLADMDAALLADVGGLEAKD